MIRLAQLGRLAARLAGVALIALPLLGTATAEAATQRQGKGKPHAAAKKGKAAAKKPAAKQKQAAAPAQRKMQKAQKAQKGRHAAAATRSHSARPARLAAVPPTARALPPTRPPALQASAHPRAEMPTQRASSQPATYPRAEPSPQRMTGQPTTLARPEAPMPKGPVPLAANETAAPTGAQMACQRDGKVYLLADCGQLAAQSAQR